MYCGIRKIIYFVSLVFIILLFSELKLHAVYEKGTSPNEIPWDVIDEKGPDKITGGWFLNIGPTGLRARITHELPTAFTVKYIFKDSPAFGKINIGDVIVGANGEIFETPHYFGRAKMDQGWRGPVRDMAKQIEDSQAGDGQLKLIVWPEGNKGNQKTITIVLEKKKRFSKTYPYNCPRSDELLKQVCDYLFQRIEADNFNTHVHGYTHAVLAMMASKDNKYEAFIKDYVENNIASRKWDLMDGIGFPNWSYGLDGIVLGEYYLRTKDEKLLPGINHYMELMRDAQTPDDGGYGHRPYPFIEKRKDEGGPAGYGAMATPAGFIMLALSLFEEAGVSIPRPTIELIHKGFLATAGVNPNGVVNYGLNKVSLAPPEPTAPFNTGKHHGNSRHHAAAGASSLAHALSDKPSWGYLSKHMATHCSGSYKGFLDGHASAVLHAVWGTLGASLADAEDFRNYMEYNKWWFIMAETHDGSFALYPGRDYGQQDTYYDRRIIATGCAAMILALKTQNLKIYQISKANGSDTIPTITDFDTIIENPQDPNNPTIPDNPFIPDGGNGGGTVTFVNNRIVTGQFNFSIIKTAGKDPIIAELYTSAADTYFAILNSGDSSLFRINKVGDKVYIESKSVLNFKSKDYYTISIHGEANGEKVRKSYNIHANNVDDPSGGYNFVEVNSDGYAIHSRPPSTNGAGVTGGGGCLFKSR